MTKTAKFTFQNLDPHERGGFTPSATPPKKRSFTDAQISEIQEMAFQDGEKRGQEASLLHIEMQAGKFLEQISSNCSELFSKVDGHIELLRGQAAELALIIAKKLAPALIASNPTAEIEVLLASCAANLNAQPRIVIRVHESLLEALKEKIELMAKKAGYPGRVVLIGETEVDGAACQIEWVDGGVTHRSSEQLALIDKKIAEFASCISPAPRGAGEIPDYQTTLTGSIK
ncbi:MAG: FliH/SctL family protein [Alphaproteobacteria bacterium]